MSKHDQMSNCILLKILGTWHGKDPVKAKVIANTFSKMTQAILKVNSVSVIFSSVFQELKLLSRVTLIKNLSVKLCGIVLFGCSSLFSKETPVLKNKFSKKFNRINHIFSKAEDRLCNAVKFRSFVGFIGVSKILAYWFFITAPCTLILTIYLVHDT